VTANQRAFLELVAACEGTLGPNGYRALFGYLYNPKTGLDNGKTFATFADHPRIRTLYTDKSGHTFPTTAAGRYQFTAATWDTLQKRYHYPDFSPESQDRATLDLCREVGALKSINAGDIENAMWRVRGIWASLPTATVPQPHRTVEFALKVYADAGGVLSTKGAQA